MTPWLDDGDVRLYHGDALDVLRQLPDGSVDAIVTSPPYADARTDVPAASLDDFALWFRPILEELARVVTRDGSLMLNLGRRFSNGYESLWHLDVLAESARAGWGRIDTIVWAKTKAVPRGGPYLHDRHEFVYWLALHADAYRGYDESTRIPHSPDTVLRYERGKLRGQKGQPIRERPPLNPDGGRPTSVFACAVGIEQGNGHPTPMANDLAAYLVCLSCPRGGTVLDPFVGSGTTAKVARDHARHAIGIDLSADYLELAARRLQQLSLLT